MRAIVKRHAFGVRLLESRRKLRYNARRMVKPSPRGGAGRKPLSRSLRMYQRIAVGFVVVTLLLLLVVLYLSIARATIHVVPIPRLVSTEVSAEVVPDPVNEGEMTGVVVVETYTKAKTFTLPNEGGTPVEEKAGGMVTLINKTGTAQPLVATTRLLSEEGVLFRIDENTVVPANGQVDVMAFADKAGLSGEIGPTQFTIPGLPTSQQDDIYAVSVESMTGGVQYVRVLSEQDLADALTSLQDEILLEAKPLMEQGVDRSVFTADVSTVELLQRKSDTQPGTEAGMFTVEVTAEVTAVYYDPSLVTNYVEANLSQQLPTGYAMESVNAAGMQVSIEDADESRGEATLIVYLDGTALLSEHAEIFDKDRFVGRSPQEVVTLLSVSEGIDEVSVTFTPFWLKRIPTLKDHIAIDIEEPQE